MTAAAAAPRAGETDVTEVDVLVVGAGLSGVGVACHLKRNLPHETVAIVEARDAIGGTWDLFRYPGIRSDSDMFTLGYSFEPWVDAKAIADGPSILDYVRATARKYDIESLIRFGQKVVAADWSSAEARWTVTVATKEGGTASYRCRFVSMCSGYYDYDTGHTPDFPGIDGFAGTLVHPQHWPEDLDYGDRQVVVIGSGATAVTLVPAMADRAAHVTMLQRSPSYILSLPASDRIADVLRARLPAKWAYPLIRRKNVFRQAFGYAISRRRPAVMKRMIRKGLTAALPPTFDIDTHFTPTYDPWDQRLCVVPDGDLFQALSSGRASIVTDTIETFVPEGIRLSSGRVLPADIVVTATGLKVKLLGGAALSSDGDPVVVSDRVGYKGTMLSDVPNLVMAIGYTNASWTLKCDLIAEWFCRVIRHLEDNGLDSFAPEPPPADQPTQAFIDLDSGYIRRALDQMPKQGSVAPWRLHQNYNKDVKLMRRSPVDDGVLRFGRAASRESLPA